MFTYNELSLKLNDSDWPKEANEILLPVLPYLGKWSLAFLSQQINRVGTEYIALDISNLFANVSSWYEDIKIGDTLEIEKEVKLILEIDQEIIQKALLALILDIRFNQPVNSILSASLSELFDKLEILYLHTLPHIEVVNMLSGRINSLLNNGDLHMEIERFCYYQGITDSTDVLDFRKALELNLSLLGKEKNIKQWIDDFMEFSASSGDRSMYNIIQYMGTSINVKSLSDEEKGHLTSILKLYNWLFKPFIDPKDIEDYERIRFQATSQADILKETVVEDRTSIAQSVITMPPSDNTRRQVNESVRATPAATLQNNKYSAPSVPVKSQQAPQVKMPGQYAANPGQIHDLINKKPREKVGVVMDPTNISLEEEKRRFKQDQADKTDIIQLKLQELRKRNQNKQ